MRHKWSVGMVQQTHSGVYVSFFNPRKNKCAQQVQVSHQLSTIQTIPPRLHKSFTRLKWDPNLLGELHQIVGL